MSYRLPTLLIVLILLAACSSTPKFGQEKDAATALQRCNTLMDKEKFNDANKCYEMVRSRFGGSGISSEAELKIADITFEKKEYLLAAESYRAFAKLHPAHPKLDYIYYMAGLSYLRESPKGIDRDQQYLEEAIGYLDIGVRYFPDSPYQEVTRGALKEARRRIAARELYVGKFYYNRQEYRASLPRFAGIADKFPGEGIDEEALYWMAKAYLEMKQRKKAFEVTAHLKGRYPNSAYLDKLIKDLDID